MERRDLIHTLEAQRMGGCFAGKKLSFQRCFVRPQSTPSERLALTSGRSIAQSNSRQSSFAVSGGITFDDLMQDALRSPYTATFTMSSTS